MQEPLITLRIKERSQQLSQKSAEMYSDLVILAARDNKALSGLPFGDVIRRRLTRRGGELSADKPFVTDLPNAAATRVSVAPVSAEAGAFELLGLARRLVAGHDRAERLAVACDALDPELAARACEAVVAAAAAAAGHMPDLRSKPEARTPLQALDLFGFKSADGYARTLAAAKGNNLARFLTALPVNELTPALYRRRVERLAHLFGWQAEFWDLKKLRARKAGAFIAVAQGSPRPDAGILRLRLRPKKKNGAKSAPLLALVGKGICFDTGGTNLKPAKGMYGMHEDMEGSAVALGTLLALTELKVDFPVDCWLALAENHIGPNAYRPNEVVTAANGTTIEIVHTDAEGRMVLADTLTFACAERPRLVIDYATLTGACVQALGTRYSGATANRDELLPKIIAAGRASGERVWPFPLDGDYEQELKSDIADVKQCSQGNEADQILAALFLKRFVEPQPGPGARGKEAPAWVHIDLSAGNHKGGLAHIPTDITGFGVRFTLSLLFDQAAVPLPK